MSEAFAHEATLELAAGSDPRSLGAAVTIALCGRLDHQPPCPLAAHHSSVEEVGDRVRLRVLFATAPSAEGRVRALIAAALARGTIRTPDGGADWTVIDSGASPVSSDETAHAHRLMNSLDT